LSYDCVYSFPARMSRRSKAHFWTRNFWDAVASGLGSTLHIGVNRSPCFPGQSSYSPDKSYATFRSPSDHASATLRSISRENRAKPLYASLLARKFLLFTV
jgi:hypothetical protein